MLPTIYGMDVIFIFQYLILQKHKVEQLLTGECNFLAVLVYLVYALGHLNFVTHVDDTYKIVGLVFGFKLTFNYCISLFR